MRHPQVIRIQQRALHQDTAETVAHPNNGVSKGPFTLSVEGEAGNERLGMLVDEVIAGTAVILARVDVGVVAVDEDICLYALEGSG